MPELKNPVVIEDRDADTLTYRPAKNPILLHHLLSHTSGIEYDLEKRTPGHLNTAYAKVGYRGGDVTEERFLEILKVGCRTLCASMLIREFHPGRASCYTSCV